MDLFEYPDDYVPEKYLTTQEMEDITNYLKNHPLFLKQVPQNIEDNEHLVALQQITGDQDPTQAAESLNQQANKRLKQNSNNKVIMKEAYEKYTEAIHIKCPTASTNAKLHANRAHLNLQLKNYGKVVQDCRVCLKFDPNYVKGFYRYAKALNTLQKYSQTIQLLKVRQQPQLQDLLKEAQKKLQIKNKIQEQKKTKKQETSNQITLYCEKRGWKTLKRDIPLPEGAKLTLMDSKLSIPLMILYPEFNQFDLVASSFEDQRIKTHLKQMIEGGLPWDKNKQYTMDNIEIYCELSEAIVMKIPPQAKIGDIASKVPLKEGLELQIVSNKSQFYPSFVSQYKII